MNKNWLPWLLPVLAGLLLLVWYDQQADNGSIQQTRQTSAERQNTVGDLPVSGASTGRDMAGGAKRGAERGNNHDNPLAGLLLSKLRATLERPLFSPQRRPPPKPIVKPVRIKRAPPPPPPPPADPSGLTLLGIIIGEQSRLAILHSTNSSKTVHLKQGGQIDDWTVKSIQIGKVTITQRGTSHTMKVFQPK